MRQNMMDRNAALYASSQNIKAAQDARADNYRYGMNANLMKTQILNWKTFCRPVRQPSRSSSRGCAPKAWWRPGAKARRSITV